MGILAFDARLGLYEDPPKDEAMRFIQGIHDFLSLSHQLFFSVSMRMAKRLNIDTPKLKKFFKTADVLIEIGESFVDKKMRELKEMADKGIDSSSDNQGTYKNSSVSINFMVWEVWWALVYGPQIGQ